MGSKFGPALAALRQPIEQPTEEPAARPAKKPRQTTAKAAETPPARRGSRGGKTANPDFHPVNLVLRIKTKRDANRRLEDTNDDRDLSELVEDLLADWLKR